VLLGQLAQPVSRQVHRLKHLVERHLLQPLERAGEGAVEAVEVAFVLHHRGAGKVVEAVDVVGDEAGLQRLEKREVFAQGNRDAAAPQMVEEAKEHRLTSPRPRGS
jgi:hypothetical protein